MSSGFKQRRGTADEWFGTNPILESGELGVEPDTGVIKVGNGASQWAQLPVSGSSVFLPIGAKAFDADRLDGLDSVSYARQSSVDVASPSRMTTVHHGSLTDWPASFRIGDRVWRSDLFCELYNTGSAWRQTEPATGTAAQRAAIATTKLYVGFEFYETDTLFERRWDGTRWEITGWRGNRAGTGTTVAGSMQSILPAMGATWTNAVIANNTATAYSNWTTVTTLPTQFATAGDAGVPLISYINQAGRAFQCNAKGRVRADLYCTSDVAQVGRSSVTLNGPNYGIWGGVPDTRHRGSGYAGSGTLEQYISVTVPVLPGDQFGCNVLQINAGNGGVSYNTFLQVAYI